MKNEFDFLNEPNFRNRPAMYIGDKSILKLKTFLDGFDTYRWINKISDNPALPFWLMLPYVEQYYHHKGLAYNWDKIILLNCENDEAKALSKFFELFDEFQKARPLAASVATIEATEIMFFHTQTNVYTIRFDENSNEVDYGPAERIYTIEYSNNLGCVLYHRFKNLEIDSRFYPSAQEAKEAVETNYGSSVNWVPGEASDALSDLYAKASAD